MGTNKRHNASRDENEPEIVDALQKAGYMVDRINGRGVPDLLVICPGADVPVFVCETAEQALKVAWRHPISLIEVKVPGKKLNNEQLKWHGKAKNANT